MTDKSNSKKNKKRKNEKSINQKVKRNISKKGNKKNKEEIKIEEKDISKTQLKEIMLIRVQDEFYGIFLDYINETINDITLIDAPNLGEFVAGVTEIGDDLIPVISLSKIIGLKTEKKVGKPVIIVKIPDKILGIQIDEIIEIKEIKENEILPIPEIFPSYILRGAYDFNGKVVGILNLDGLLKEKNIQSSIDLD
jgi:purine-binding chemotaxis protein CheW